MPLSDVEFGKKASTASGYNTMCKEGVSFWTKQQRVAKQRNEALLTKLESGELEVKDLEAERAAIEGERKEIRPSVVNDGLLFDSEEELLG
jgi:hypothetical protein